MLENYTLVGQGFRVLLKSLSGYIGKEMSQRFGACWWDEVLQVLNDQRDLPVSGEYYDRYLERFYANENLYYRELESVEEV